MIKYAERQTSKNIIANEKIGNIETAEKIKTINIVLEIIEQQYAPKTDDCKVLRAIQKHHINSPYMAIIGAYNYGIMQGKRIERSLKKSIL